LTVKNIAGFLLVVVLVSLLISPLPAAAISAHYETDKSYYHPGDSGALLFVTTGGASPGTYLFTAYMNITGIGNFVWNFTGLPLANLPPGEHAFVVSPGQTVKVMIPFTIPADAKLGDYQYSATLVASEGGAPFGQPLTVYGSLNVVPVGTNPTPSQGISGVSLFPLTALGLGIELLGLLVGRISHWIRPPRPALSAEVESIKKKTKTVTGLGLLCAVICLVLWFEGGSMTNPPALLTAAFVCLLVIAISSVSGALVRDGLIPSSHEKRARWAIGLAITALILVPVGISATFGTSFEPLQQLPAVILAVALLVPRTYSKKTTTVFIFLAAAFAFWPGPGGTGPFGPAWPDLFSGWYSPFVSGWPLRDLVSTWSLLVEKAIALGGFAWLLVRRQIHPPLATV
jgi:hypothetical protein